MKVTVGDLSGGKYAYSCMETKITLEFTDMKTCQNFLKAMAKPYLTVKYKMQFSGSVLPLPYHNIKVSLFEDTGFATIRDVFSFIHNILSTSLYKSLHSAFIYP